MQSGLPRYLQLQAQTKVYLDQPGEAFEQEAETAGRALLVEPAVSTPSFTTLGPATLEKEGQNLEAGMPSDSVVPPIVDDVLQSPGQPLDPSTLALMEARLGRKFSDVRVHTDNAAAKSARAVNASAFTVGRQVVFGEGQYGPETKEGGELLAHELAHTIHQEKLPKAVDSLTGRISATMGSPNEGAHSVAIQRQKTPDKQAMAQGRGSMKDIEKLVAELKERIAFLAAPLLKLEAAYKSERLAQIQLIPDAGQQVHQALAFAFLLHNPEASIKSMNDEAVGIDTRDIPKWKEKEPLEEFSHGTYLATKFQAYKKFFITGPGTLWITRAGVKADASEYRDFLSRSGSVPESELAEILDSGYQQYADAAGRWIKSWDRETPREAPLVVQLIADLNPLTGIAKFLSLCLEDKPLYAMPGSKATTLDWVEGWVGLAAAGEALFGDLLAMSVKGVKASKAVSIGRTVANPTSKISEAIVEKWTKECIKDEAVKKLIADIIALGFDKGLWDGVIRNVDKAIDDRGKSSATLLKP